jgi:hypothetical protein
MCPALTQTRFHKIYSSGLSLALCVGLGFLVWLRFALRSLAVWRVRAIAPSFIFGWRAFSSVSLCKNMFERLPQDVWHGSCSHQRTPHCQNRQTRHLVMVSIAPGETAVFTVPGAVVCWGF